jgi:hypothetical protein
MHSLKLVSDVSYFLCQMFAHTKIILSCLANPDSLDTPCRHRSAIHTDVLIGLHDEETLRKVYGIIAGATVNILHYVSGSLLMPISHTRRISPGLTYLNSSLLTCYIN